MDLRSSLDLFVALLNVFIVHQISFFCLSILLCLFSCLFGDRWASVACQGCQALALTIPSLLQDLLFSYGDLVVEAQMTVSETLKAKQHRLLTRASPLAQLLFVPLPLLGILNSHSKFPIFISMIKVIIVK